DRNPVTVGDRGADHRIAGDAEQERVALTDEVLRQREGVLDGLFRQYGAACGDSADEGDVGGAGGTRRSWCALGAAGRGEVATRVGCSSQDTDGAGAIGIPPEIAFAL